LPETGLLSYRLLAVLGSGKGRGGGIWGGCKAGKLLVETVNHEGGRPKPLQGERVLKDMGINYSQSHRWQTIAGVPSKLT